MSTGKTNLTSTQFAAKKLLGKAHTSNLKGDVNESIPSNVSMPSDGVFSETIPNSPGDTFMMQTLPVVVVMKHQLVGRTVIIYNCRQIIKLRLQTLKEELVLLLIAREFMIHEDLCS